MDGRCGPARLLGADDFLLTVTGVDKITDHYVRVCFDDGGLLAHKGVHPTMWIRLWFDNDGKPAPARVPSPRRP